MDIKQLWRVEGSWSVQLEDGVHSVAAELNHSIHRLKITWDGAVIEKCTVLFMLGKIRSFTRSGHSFVLEAKPRKLLGVVPTNSVGELVLSMDGVELPRAIEPPASMSSPEHPEPLAASPHFAATPVRPSGQQLQFVEEEHVVESEETVSVDDYPLDNTFGSEPFTTEHTVSKESTNELTLEKAHQVGGTAGLSVPYVKAEVAAHLSWKTGTLIGQRVTETQTLRFSVGANRKVVYQVIWKRKVRTGEQLFLTDGGPLRVPYRLTYGLSLEVRTMEPKSAGR
jgi:hypothetical protein